MQNCAAWFSLSLFKMRSDFENANIDRKSPVTKNGAETKIGNLVSKPQSITNGAAAPKRLAKMIFFIVAPRRFLSFFNIATQIENVYDISLELRA